MAHEMPLTKERRPVKDGLLAGPLDRLDEVRLCGTRCAVCREVALGRNEVCLNCGGDAVAAEKLADRGVLWTFTVVRHRPPGDYRGPEPFEPFGLGLVELPEGIRVMAPIGCDIDRLEIGMPLQFRPLVRSDADGVETVHFDYVALSNEAAHV